MDRRNVQSMDLQRGWNIAERDLRTWRLLEHIADNSRGSDVTTLPEWAQNTTSSEYADALEDVSEFDSHGWFDINNPGAALPTLRISGAGADQVRTIRMRRNDRGIRTKEIDDAMLYWLDAERVAGVSQPVIDRFTETPYGLWYGAPFPGTEVIDSGDWLHELGFIKGVRIEEAGVIRPKLTPKGLAVVNREGSVHDTHESSVAGVIHQTTWNVGPNAQIQQGNQTANINNVTNSEQAETVATLVAILGDLATERDDTPGADSAADDLEAAAAGPDRGAIRRAVVIAQSAAMAAIGTDLGNQAVHLSNHLLWQLV